MSEGQTKACPRCRRQTPADADACAECGTDLSIISMPLETIPPDIGIPDREDAEVSIEAPAAEILPPESEVLPGGDGWTRSYSVSTSFTSVTSTGRDTTRHTDAELSLQLPQALVDPQRLLAPDQYGRLMADWSEAIEREIEEATEAGERPGFDEAARRVPMPFGPQSGSNLTLAQREAMTRRAQAQAARLLSIPNTFAGLGASPAGPARSLIEHAHRGSGRKGRGIMVSCGSLVAALLLGGGLIVAFLWVSHP